MPFPILRLPSGRWIADVQPPAIQNFLLTEKSLLSKGTEGFLFILELF